MQKNKLKYFVIPFLLIIFAGFYTANTDIYLKMTKSIEVFGKIYKEINLNYVDDVDPEEFMYEGIKGMLSSLDPYTAYIDESLQQDVDLITNGKYGGIGATIGLRNNFITIIELLEGYSAQRQGLKVGDIITKIDDTKMGRKNYNDLSSYMKGKPGSLVKINIKRDGVEEELVFNLLREQIEVKNVTYYGFVPKESNNAYIKLSGFSRAAGKEVGNAIKDLKAQKELKSIILDLRGNPGGLLDAAIDVTEKFVNKNELIVSVIGRDTSEVKKYYSSEEPIAGNSKVIVLVDGGTASASEIVAGAIQDHDRGVVLGDPSFGKGLVQTLVPLSYNTSLKITTAKYYTPSGRCIQRVDYADNNKVISPTVKITEKKFLTDNSREVYSGGGIYPDSLVKNNSDSKQVNELLAIGMFFRFATNYSNLSKELKLENISTDDLFNDFKKYIREQEYDYTSQTEKLLGQIQVAAKKDKILNEISQQISDLSTSISKIYEKEIDNQKEDIISEIEKELATRIEGRDGRIKASLKYDNHFSTAIKVLKDDLVYNRLLNGAIQN